MRLAQQITVIIALPFALLGQRTEIAAPVENFRLPVFGDDGNRVWELRGQTGTHRDDRTIAVERMVLQTFAPGNPQHAELIIESPRAVIIPEKNQATGDGYLFLQATDGHYAIVGRQWRWFGDEERITIKEDARVTFRQSMGGILE